ncbi:MAG: DUF1801 domain-containing protein [Bacteroidota bacterium]
MEPHPQLKTFLEPYKANIQQLLFGLRTFITDLVPEANELIWDNYNAVAIAYSKSQKLKDAFCHLAVYANYVNFGFNRGAELTKSTIQLKGSGKLIRHFKVTDIDSFPKDAIKPIIWEAVGLSEMLNPDLIALSTTPESLVMSVSPKKRRPKKNT